ncbi:MAG: helix-turn-helix domain-containing protein [Microlunatus sp.]|nr:helix-turn-helix domain-containing protein [Microlunatus sp.]MDN5769927.1 helix-turn-helix domain-containing protein [Microlunatus sp.]MDN5804221.1 helix-turn-helix domain-containing protein [Microlunatus sp.]
MKKRRNHAGLEALPQLSNLVDPVRRRLYEYVVAQAVPVTREGAAAATGVARPLVAYHLDKLTDAGLIEAGYARPEGRRGGPGAGRPAKHYTRAGQELTVTVPARSYLLMADLLAAAVESDQSGSVHAAATRLARQVGRAAGADAGVDLDAALQDLGYEPARTQDGDIEMRNCPFHQLSQTHTDLVCSLNLDLINGLLEAAAEPVDRAERCPQEGRCCVVIHPPAPR